MFVRTYIMPITPLTIQQLFAELAGARASQNRAWRSLQWLRLAIGEVAGRLPPAAGAKDFQQQAELLAGTIRQVLDDRETALDELTTAARAFHVASEARLWEESPLYLEAQERLRKALARAEEFSDAENERVLFC
jgi:hypothetical protein